AGSLPLAAGAGTLHAPIAFFYAVVVMTSAASTLDQSARAATVPRLVPRHLLPSAVSLSQVMLQSAAMVGPALAGLAIASVGVSWAFVFDAAGCLPAAALVSRLSPPPPPDGHGAALGVGAPAQAIGCGRRTRLGLGLCAAGLGAMIFGTPSALFPALALSVFGIGARGLGLLYAAPAAGALVGSLLSGWVRRVSRQGMAVLF